MNYDLIILSLFWNKNLAHKSWTVIIGNPSDIELMSHWTWILCVDMAIAQGRSNVLQHCMKQIASPVEDGPVLTSLCLQKVQLKSVAVYPHICQWTSQRALSLVRVMMIRVNGTSRRNGSLAPPPS